MNTPKVSAVITTRNRLDLLRRAVDAVYAQTYPDIELIVVDDASTDGTKDYCNSQSFKYIRIEPEESKGGNHARNIGIQASTGDYIAFCDDDDYWMPEKTQLQVELMKSKEYDFVFCGRRLEIVINDSTEYVEKIPTEYSDGDISKKSFRDIFILTSTLMVKRSVLFDIGLFDENIKAWQEHELVIRLSQQSYTESIKLPLVIYRIDIKDPHRLTNKYHQWKESVRYIERKHSDKMSLRDKVRFKALAAADGIGRAKASGLKWQWWKNRFLVNLYKIVRI